MLGFLARTAIRTGTRVAVHGIMEQQRASARQYAAAVAAANTPFSIVPDATGETALFLDKRIGLGHALPGYPRPLGIVPGPNEPPCDALVAVAELPAGVRYLTGPAIVHATDAMDLALKQAQLYVDTRTATRGVVPVSPANAAQCATYSVHAAALAEYPLPVPDAFGATHEELIFLVRSGHTAVVTLRYARDAIDPVALASFRSIARASLTWDPLRPATPPRLWPESSYLAPGLGSQLHPHRQAQVPYLVPAMAVDPGEREAIGDVIDAMLTGDAPPWLGAPPGEIDQWATRLTHASSSPGFAQMVRTVIADVRTIRDVRGFAVLLSAAAQAAWTS